MAVFARCIAATYDTQDTVIVETEPSETVRSVRVAVAKVTGIKLDSFALWHNRAVMDDVRTIGSFDLQDHAPLDMTVRLGCPPDKFSDGGTCTDADPCPSPSRFLLIPSTSTSQRMCAHVTMCNATSYQIIASTSTSDRACQSLTPCKTTDFQNVRPTMTSDRKCRHIRKCHQCETELAAPTRTSDRVCAEKKECPGGIDAPRSVTTALVDSVLYHGSDIRDFFFSSTNMVGFLFQIGAFAAPFRIEEIVFYMRQARKDVTETYVSISIGVPVLQNNVRLLSSDELLAEPRHVKLGRSWSPVVFAAFDYEFEPGAAYFCIIQVLGDVYIGVTSLEPSLDANIALFSSGFSEAPDPSWQDFGDGLQLSLYIQQV